MSGRPTRSQVLRDLEKAEKYVARMTETPSRASRRAAAIRAVNDGTPTLRQIILSGVQWADEELAPIHAFLAGWILHKPTFHYDESLYWDVVSYPPDESPPAERLTNLRRAWRGFLDETAWDEAREANFVRLRLRLSHGADYMEAMRWATFVLLSELGDDQGLKFRRRIWQPSKSGTRWRLDEQFAAEAMTSTDEIRCAAEHFESINLVSSLYRHFLEQEANGRSG